MQMRVTRQSSFANTAIVGNITYRDVGIYAIPLILGGFLFFSIEPFKFNFIAIIAYVALVSIIVGRTPTDRTILKNIYGILFKKPVRMVVSELATENTLGHGVREVLFPDDLDVPAFKMGTGNYALVYNITSGLTQWSDESEYTAQATRVKSLFNVMEGHEGLLIVTKTDADTGMASLEQALSDIEDYSGSDLEKLAQERRGLLHNVATSKNGRSVQQYAILLVKPKNVKRCVKELQRSSRIIRPATHPGDILLSAMGFEAGADQDY